MRQLHVFLVCLLVWANPLHLFAQTDEGLGTQSAEVALGVNMDPPPDAAAIIVYRVPSLKGMAWTHQIFVDGLHVAGIKSKEYTKIVVAPGMYEVSTGSKKNPRYLISTVIAQAGETYFIEDLPGMRLYDSDRFFGIDEPLALEKLGKKYKYKAPLIDQIRPQGAEVQ
jgi:hypothetical protein